MPVYLFQDFFPPWTALLGSPRLLNFDNISTLPIYYFKGIFQPFQSCSISLIYKHTDIAYTVTYRDKKQFLFLILLEIIA